MRPNNSVQLGMCVSTLKEQETDFFLNILQFVVKDGKTVKKILTGYAIIVLVRNSNVLFKILHKVKLE